MPDKSELGLTTYTWGDNSIIPQIDVRSDGVAYIHASKNAQNLPELRKLFAEKGWTMLSEMLGNNQPVLQISGFNNADEIVTLLAGTKAVTGSPSVNQAVPENKKKNLNIKENSLRASGLSYTIGNLLYMAYGFLANNKEFKRIGYTWNIADVIMFFFGRKDEKIESMLLTNHLNRHFSENGIPVQPEDAINIESLAQQNSGAMAKTKYFVHNQVTAIKSISEVIGGGLMIKDGLKSRKEGAAGGTSTMVAGGALITGFGGAGIIREKKIDPEKYAKANPLQKVWMKIQARPLQLGAISGVINNIFNAVAVFGQHREANRTGERRNYIARGLGVGALLIANILYFISHKTGGNIRNSTLIDDIYSKTAQVLEHLDPQAREIGIKQAAEFLGQRTEIKDTKEEIEANLRREIEELRHNPWFATDGIQNPMQNKSATAMKFQPADTQSLVTAGNNQAIQTLQTIPGVKTTALSPNPSLDTVTVASSPLQHTPQVT